MKQGLFEYVNAVELLLGEYFVLVHMSTPENVTSYMLLMFYTREFGHDGRGVLFWVAVLWYSVFGLQTTLYQRPLNIDE